jgi:predicted lipid-binding transport protein (Tim44 family)
MPGPDPAREEAEQAAADAAAIGGQPSSEPPPAAGAPDEAQRPLAESGQGEAEGFELAEEKLVEHASHGDQHAARRVIQDAPQESDDEAAAEGGEGDHEHSSEREDELP